jgi:hypothetical protein
MNASVVKASIQIVIQLNNEKSHRNNCDQQWSKRKPKIAASSEKNLAVSTEHDRKLILKQTNGEQVSLQAVLGARDRSGLKSSETRTISRPTMTYPATHQGIQP